MIGWRLSRRPNRRAPADEVLALTDCYCQRFRGLNVRHFHSWYRKDGGARSYTWVKKRLQEAGLVRVGKRRGAHRKKRERMPLPGMMIHQDGRPHEWIAGPWCDLIVTMDDATNHHYSTFLVPEEGTVSSFRGVSDVTEAHGLFCSFYSDRGSHY